MKLSTIAWLDSRLHKPPCNSGSWYFVQFLCCESVFDGIAFWQPKDSYTDGEWTKVQCLNTNPLGGDVLYWHDFPQRPAIV